MNLNSDCAHKAAANGKWDDVKALAGKGVEIKSVDSKGHSLLWRAANGLADFEAAKWLIGQKVPCLGGKSGTPWLIYLYSGFRQRGEHDCADYINRGFFHMCDEIMMRKFLAHRFSIKDSFGMSGRTFSYGGFLTDFTFPELGRSVEKFFSECKTDLTPQEKRGIAEAFVICDSRADPANLYKRYQQGKIVNIPTGWHNHSTTIVLKKGSFLIKGNKGTGRGRKSLQVFEIGKPENITRELFQGLLSTYRCPGSSKEKKLRQSYQSKSFFKKGINEKLGLIYLPKISLATHRQKSDNCCWSSSAKPSFRADLFLTYHQRGLQPKAAWEKTERLFKKWVAWDRDAYFREYLAGPPESKDRKLINLITQKSSSCSFQSSRQV